jgi:ATP-binding cassette subfamily B protein
MDEATASLDPDSEQFVQESIRMLASEGKTIIFITHRLAAVQQFDRLYVLDKGKLIEEGSHQELIIAKGKYYQMIQKQLLVLS